MKIIFTFVFGLLFVAAIAQQNVYSKTFAGGPISYIPKCAAMGPSKGLVVVGQSLGGSGAALITRLDSNANVIWHKQWNGDPNLIYDLVVGSDSTIFVTGYTGSSLLCGLMNAQGNVLWSQSFTDSAGRNMVGYACSPTNDQAFIVAGLVGSGHTFLAKIDKLGNTHWLRVFITSHGRIQIRSAKQTADSGFVLVGDIYSGIVGHLFIKKLDKNGEVKWSKNYSVGQTAGDIVITEDGYVASFDDSWGAGSGLIKTDFSGNVMWCRKSSRMANLIFGAAVPVRAKIQETHDKGFIFHSRLALSPSFPGANWLEKVDSLGNFVWSKQLNMYASFCAELPDRHLINVGWADQNELVLIQTDSMGVGTGTCVSPSQISMIQVTVSVASLADTICNGFMSMPANPVLSTYTLPSYTGCSDVPVGIEEHSKKSSFTIVPNPGSGSFSIVGQALSVDLKVSIYDAIGKLCHTQMLIDDKIRVDFLPPGLYTVMISRKENFLATEKLIISE